MIHGVRALQEGAVSEYFGGFKDGKFEGKGEMLTNHGMWYKGEYKNGLKDGTGVLYLATSERLDLIGQVYLRYEGQFKEDEFHG